MKKLISLILICILLLCLISCEKKEKKYTEYLFDYFDTSISIVGFEKDKKTFDNICEKIKNKLEKYHKYYDIYNQYDGINNIYTINNSDTVVEVDSEIIYLLEFSKEMYNLTDGQLNVAMGSVLSLWHNYRTKGINDPKNAKIPNLLELSKAEEHTDIKKMIVGSNLVNLTDPEMTIDVGAVAKGYATEQVALWMEKEGITGYLLNVGGNIRTVGKRPDGEKWQIGLENPDRESAQAYIEYLELEDMSIVTSGSYQRFYTVDGEKYHHIIDPDTSMPASGYKMVSVIAPDSAMADALSTALFCMEYNEGSAVINDTENTYAMWVLENGEKLYSNGFRQFIKKVEK